MEFIAILVAGLLGWHNGTLGRQDLKLIALVVIGWSAVTSAAAVPYLTFTAMVFDLVYHTLVVAVPYVLGVLVKRLSQRRR